MNKRFTYNLQIIFLAVISLSFGLMLNSVLKNKEHKRIDLSKGSITSLNRRSIDTLFNLQSPVKISYYTSERKRMPTAMKNLEDDIRAILRQMSQHGRQNLTYEVVYPEDTPQVARGLGRFGISSFQFKTIKKDEYSVNTIWSSILIEYKGQSRGILYITRDHLPHLENKIITHIRQIETGYKPFIALSSAAGTHNELKKLVASLDCGEVKDFTFTEKDGIPIDADMAFICGPENLTKENVENIKNFLKDGKDVFITFSNYGIMENPSGFEFVQGKTGLEEYLFDIGVKIEQQILLEETSYQGRQYLISIPTNQLNMDGFRMQRCGTMFLPFSSPLTVDMVKLRKNGFTCDTLIFSSKNSWSIPFPEKQNELKELVQSGFVRSKTQNAEVKNIGIVLTSDKAWEGRLFLYSCGNLFSDVAGGYGANQLYLKIIFMTFVQGNNKLTSIRQSREIKPAIPQLDAYQRLLWRFVVMFLVPLFMFIMLMFKIIKYHNFNFKIKKFDIRIISVCILAVIMVFSLTLFAKSFGDISFDLTKNKTNSLNPATMEWIKNLQFDAKVIYFTSPASDMPINSKKMVKEVFEKLKSISKTSSGRLKFYLNLVPSGAESDSKLKTNLDKYGIKPFKMKMIENDRYIEKMVYSGLVFENKDNFEAVPSLTLQNSERLEFITVTALKRLDEQKKPTIALMADLPHVTAGEFWELQQLEVAYQPRSEDVYSKLLEILRNEGYEVKIYDSQADIECKEDILIYIQPWVVTEKMKKAINEFLLSGKNVLVACQHYKMQTRKYSGRAYELAYWPQNQFSRINELLNPYGIELIEEIFLDQSKAPIDTREQIRWGAYKKYDKRSPDAQPFIIRAIPENYNSESAITKGLSDILFIWGNRWHTIKDKFPKTLKWDPLISSTQDCWPLNWKGGFLTEDLLVGGNYLDVKEPLCVMVEGFFPNLYGLGKNNDSKKTAKLLLIGTSKILENEQLDMTKYDHEKFILNAVADLTYGTALAEIQSSGTSIFEGLPFISPSQKMLWRFIVLALVPILFLILAIVIKIRRQSHKIVF